MGAGTRHLRSWCQQPDTRQRHQRAAGWNRDQFFRHAAGDCKHHRHRNDRDPFHRQGCHLVGADQPTLVIAEIGINHNGSVDLARRLVDHAVEAGASCAKFQLRDMDALYRQGGGGSSAGEDLGPQYTLDLLSKFSLSRDDLFRVFDHCADVGIDVMCTPWDAPSVDALLAYGVPALKIASADLTNHTLLRHASGHGIPLVISTGMSTEAEIRDSVEVVKATGTAYALLHCQSTYPAPFKDVNLRYLERLAEIEGRCRSQVRTRSTR